MGEWSRVNEDGSVTVGILEDTIKPEAVETVEKPVEKPKKKTTKKK